MSLVRNIFLGFLQEPRSDNAFISLFIITGNSGTRAGDELCHLVNPVMFLALSSSRGIPESTVSTYGLESSFSSDLIVNLRVLSWARLTFRDSIGSGCDITCELCQSLHYPTHCSTTLAHPISLLVSNLKKLVLSSMRISLFRLGAA